MKGATLLFLFIFLSWPSLTICKTIDESPLKKAKGLLGVNVEFKMVAEGHGVIPSYFVYAAQRPEKGFVIVSGETDNYEVLAFSENGEFSSESIPPQLEWWLNFYEEQMNMIVSSSASAYSSVSSFNEVCPLIQTKWDQTNPYNSLTPEYSLNDQLYHSTTGCVATAMSQIMKYWSAQIETTAIPAYTSSRLQKYMPELPPTIFNYSLMENTYPSYAVGESSDEVARLMLYCGQAVKMNYHQTSYAEMSGVPFSQFFGFSPNWHDVSRDKYSCSEWESLIYNELSSGRPILYSGAKYPNSGHTFIIDGYRDGYYHFNWGWGGMYDGYYKLSVAMPTGSEGSGAGQGQGGYTFRQKALIGLQPFDQASELTVKAMTVEKISLPDSRYSRNSIEENFSLPLVYSVFNRTGNHLHCYTGIGVYQSGELIKTYQNSLNDFSDNSGFSNRKQEILFGEGITSGDYVVKAIFRLYDEDTWQEDIGSNLYMISLHIDGNTLTATLPIENSLQVNDVTFEGSMKVTRESIAHINITNLGIEHYSTIYLKLDGTTVSGSGLYLDQNETQDLSIYFTPNEVGDHEVTITDGSKTLWTGSLHVNQRPDPILSIVGDPIVYNLNGSRHEGTTVKMSVEFYNEDSQVFDDEIIFKLFIVDDIVDEFDGRTYQGHSVDTKHVDTVIPAHKSNRVDVSFDNLHVDDSYWIRAYTYRASTNTLVQYSKSSGVFTVVSDPNSMERVSLNDCADNSTIYDLQGRHINAITKKGIYVINGRKYVAK